jgi:hypothetical protein
MFINKTKLWWGIFGLVVLVLASVNIYLFWLKKVTYEFIGNEAMLSNKRTEQIHDFRRLVR